MDWRISLFSRDKRTHLHTAIVLILSVLFLFLGPQFAALTGNVFTTLFYYPFFKLRDKVSHLAATAEDNVSLRTSIVELTTKLQFYDEAMQENRRLKLLMEFVPPSGYRVLPAKIITVSGVGIPNTVQINLGSDQGLRENFTVIDPRGVAGRVAQVTPAHSMVYLLTEPRCRVSARVKRSRELGIIRFSMSRGMFLDNVPTQGDVRVGDTIISSGLGGLFPEGLIIGTVIDLDTPERGFFFDISLVPAVDFNALEELYVLVPER